VLRPTGPGFRIRPIRPFDGRILCIAVPITYVMTATKTRWMCIDCGLNVFIVVTVLKEGVSSYLDMFTVVLTLQRPTSQFQ
jgi:hypothetical protein